MGKALDITGKKFNSLTAISREPSKNGKTYWKFLCDCGNEKVIQTNHVVNGTIKSCGCLKTKINITLRCPICNEQFKITDFSQINRKYCFKCSPSTNNPTEKTKAIRKRLIIDRGGKCERCGYNKCLAALEFHHLNPADKEFSISNNGLPSFEKAQKEANKCILLCANCHREEHNKEEE